MTLNLSSFEQKKDDNHFYQKERGMFDKNDAW